MKKHIAIISVILCFALATPIFAQNISKRETKTVVLKKKPYKFPDQPLDPEGRRSTSQPIVAVISSAGIQIPDIRKSDILSYDIYNENGEAVITSSSEKEFVDHVLTLTGAIEINILLPDYILFGFID